MSRTVLYIIGASYSGSSILSLLLDSHPRIRALGEIIHLHKARNVAYCSACQRPAEKCTLNEYVERDRFYGSIFDFYSDCEILVDSSKMIETTYLAHVHEVNLKQCMLVLSKSPREFAYSWIHHHPAESVASAYEAYFQFYRDELEQLDRLRFCANDVAMFVSYRELIKDTDTSLNRLFRRLNVSAWRVSEADWWDTDSHIIGGNNMVAAQIRNWDRKLECATEHQRMRYKPRHHQVFYDDAWMNDTPFLQKCEQLEAEFSDDQLKILRQIKQPLENNELRAVDSTLHQTN